jgi:arsenate reductase
MRSRGIGGSCLLALIAMACSQQSSRESGSGPVDYLAKEFSVMHTASLLPRLSDSVARRAAEFDRIDTQRKAALLELAEFVSRKIVDDEPARVTFICTHNSRRSHMAQIWAQTAAAVYDISGVETYSGGTEATAFNPRAVAALERAGFDFETEEQGSNPVSLVRVGDGIEPMNAFSKVYDQPPNPTSEFAAVMTCSQADASCPMVRGAEERIAITYEDPKSFDGTEREAEAYDERCRQIAREMLFVFSQVRS